MKMPKIATYAELDACRYDPTGDELHILETGARFRWDPDSTEEESEDVFRLAFAREDAPGRWVRIPD